MYQEPSTSILSPYILEGNNTQIRKVLCSPSLWKFVRNKNPLYKLIASIEGRKLWKAHVVQTSIKKSNTLQEALWRSNATLWQKAIEFELDSLRKNKTWTITNRKLMGCKWSFKIKLKANGSVDKYKARLVAKGYSQVLEIDYNETFSFDVKLTSIIIIFVLVTQFDLKVQ